MISSNKTSNKWLHHTNILHILDCSCSLLCCCCYCGKNFYHIYYYCEYTQNPLFGIYVVTSHLPALAQLKLTQAKNMCFCKNTKACHITQKQDCSSISEWTKIGLSCILALGLCVLHLLHPSFSLPANSLPQIIWTK